VVRTLWGFCVVGLIAGQIACGAAGCSVPAKAKPKAAPAKTGSSASHPMSASSNAGRDAAIKVAVDASSGSGGGADARAPMTVKGDDGDAGGTLPASPDASSDASAAPVAVPAPQAQGCVMSVAAGHTTLMCQGLTFELNVPEACIATQCGLIIDVHGGTMSAAMENKNTNMRELGRMHGYVVIQPNANLGLFDAMADDPVVFDFANNVADVFHLDRQRIHMMGFSQGGYMTWRFICAHTDWLASAAPAAAAGAANISSEVGCTFTGTDQPKGEVDIMYMHGHKDALVDFANAQVLRDAVIATYAAMQHEVVASSSSYTRTRYTSPHGTRFEFIEHDYVSNSAVGVPPLGVAIEGHCYPGSPDHELTEDGQLMAFGCEAPNDFTWGEEAIRFFQDHPHR
jgi:hypothetical protein